MNRSKGAILGVMLFFLSLVSFLTFRLLEITLLESKMTIFHQDKIKSFYLAEKKLQKAEQELLTNGETKEAEVNFFDGGICGVDFYRVTVKVDYQGAKTCLQSSIAKIRKSHYCPFNPKISPGRHSFF